MYIKKLFYKLANKDKHFHYKMNLKKAASIKQNIEIFKVKLMTVIKIYTMSDQP